MANRNFTAEKGNIQRGMYSLNGTWAVGGTGAVTSNEGTGKQGMTLTRTGVGAYTIALQDPCIRIMGPNISVTASAGSSSDGLCAYVLTANATTKTITFQLRANNFAAAEAPNGATIHIEVRCKDSTV